MSAPIWKLTEFMPALAQLEQAAIPEATVYPFRPYGQIQLPALYHMFDEVLTTDRDQRSKRDRLAIVTVVADAASSDQDDLWERLAGMADRLRVAYDDEFDSSRPLGAHAAERRGLWPYEDEIGGGSGIAVNGIAIDLYVDLIRRTQPRP